MPFIATPKCDEFAVQFRYFDDGLSYQAPENGQLIVVRFAVVVKL